MSIDAAFIILRQIGALAFLVSGLTKALVRQGSVHAVRSYRILPSPVDSVLGHILPWLELAVGACLLIDLATPSIAVLGMCLLALFLAAQISIVARGMKDIDCGCFGTSPGKDESVGYWTITRTALLCGLFAILAIGYRNPSIIARLEGTDLFRCQAIQLLTTSLLANLVAFRQIRSNRAILRRG